MPGMLSGHSEMKDFGFILLSVFGVILRFSAPAYAVTSERTATTISINITPADPKEGDDDTVTGLLQTATGETLGNKSV